jgi:hypothetical protein
LLDTIGWQIEVKQWVKWLLEAARFSSHTPCIVLQLQSHNFLRVDKTARNLQFFFNEYQKQNTTFLGSRARPVPRADYVTAICEPIVWTSWDP